MLLSTKLVFLLTTSIFVIQWSQRIAALTSYRGVEAIDCVGMQLIVELVLGLCDNLKPNRFFGTERKRFTRALHMQGPLFLQRNEYEYIFLPTQLSSFWIDCQNKQNQLIHNSQPDSYSSRQTTSYIFLIVFVLSSIIHE